MSRALVFLADGFEEMEAIIVIDTLRRAGVEVTTAGLHDAPIVASRQTKHIADRSIDQISQEVYDLVVLPGGGQGAKNLEADSRVAAILRRHQSADKYIGAICAAPAVLRAHGIIKGNDPFTMYPGLAAKSSGGEYRADQRVVRAGKITTSQGPGTSFEFALDLVEQLCGPAKKEEVARGMLVAG